MISGAHAVAAAWRHPGQMLWPLLCLCAVVLIGASSRSVPLLAEAERFASDARLVAFEPERPRRDDIVFVAINADSFARIGVRSPVPRGFLAELVTVLESAQPRAIAIDILFDQPTADPGGDAAFFTALREARVPVVLPWLPAPPRSTFVNAAQAAFLDGWFASLDGSAVRKGRADVAIRGPDGAIRDMQLRWRPDEPGFASAIAHAAGADVEGAGRVAAFLPYGDPARSDRHFTILPAHLLLELPESARDIVLARLTDRVVMVGVDEPLRDKYWTAWSRFAPPSEKDVSGVFLLGHMVAQLIDGRRAVMPGIWPFVVAAAVGLAGFAVGRAPARTLHRVGLAVLLAALSAAAILGLDAATAADGHGRIALPLVGPLLAAIGGVFCGAGAAWAEDRERRRFVSRALSHYVPPSVARNLERDPSQLTLFGESRDITVLFADIEAFTPLAETLEPQMLGGLLNAYLEGLTSVILEYGGTLDKYVGDAVVAFWGAPADAPDGAEAAAMAAAEMLLWSREYSARWRSKGVALGTIRIGINSGAAIVGNFGSLSRYNYTAIGDVVNIAARLEAANKQFGSSILCAGAEPPVDLPSVPIGNVRLRGRSAGIEVFAIDPAWPMSSAHAWRDACDAPSEAAAARMRDVISSAVLPEKLAMLKLAQIEGDHLEPVILETQQG